MTDPITEFEVHLRGVDPGLLTLFESRYEDPPINGNGLLNFSCRRCGAEVPTSAQAVNEHLDWHHALSLAIFTIGSTLRTLTTEVP